MHQASSPFTSRYLRSGLALAGGLFALVSSGCAALIGEQTAETKFLVKPAGDATFWGWSEITIEEDANSVNKATLRAVTIEPMDNPDVADMTFLQNIVGEAVTSKERTKLIDQPSLPPGERLVSVKVVYNDDLRPFFEDGHTIRVEYAGQTNPAFTAWPAEGIWVRVRVHVVIE